MSQNISSEALLRHAMAQITRRQEVNELDRDAWMKLHVGQGLLSGKLTHAWRNAAHYQTQSRAGIDWQDQYIRERVKRTFGFGFEAVADSRLQVAPVKIGRADTAMTETCWHADILNDKTPFRCSHAPIQIKVEYEDGEEVEGIGLLLEFQSGHRPKWLPANYQIFALTSRVTTGSDGKRRQSTVLNPA